MVSTASLMNRPQAETVRKNWHLTQLTPWVMANMRIGQRTQIMGSSCPPVFLLTLQKAHVDGSDGKERRAVAPPPCSNVLNIPRLD